eukprot:766801-Prorocentrum_minimum.AAC.1
MSAVQTLDWKSMLKSSDKYCALPSKPVRARGSCEGSSRAPGRHRNEQNEPKLTKINQTKQRIAPYNSRY